MTPCILKLDIRIFKERAATLTCFSETGGQQFVLNRRTATGVFFLFHCTVTQE